MPKVAINARHPNTRFQQKCWTVPLKWVRLQKNGKSRSIYDAGWSSLVARRAHNPEVVGSNPTPATIPSLQNTNKTGPFSRGPVNFPKIVLELYRQFAALDTATLSR
jgi:hypothetical protein